jgi:tetratricopeptide (TPR) repeat protein
VRDSRLAAAEVTAGSEHEAAARRDAQQVWRSGRELGAGGAGLASLGQSTVAILAGFDLTTVVLLSASHQDGAIHQAATACLGVAAAVFVLALAFIASAEDYSATPDERLMYHPEARVCEEELDTQRGLQRQDYNILAIYYNHRVLPSVTCAVLLTLAGLALAVMQGGLSPGSAVAVTAAAAVVVIYLADFLIGRRGGNWWLFPRAILPAWSPDRFNQAYPDTGRLGSRQRRRRFRSEIVRLPLPRDAMSPLGRAAMLPDHGSDADRPPAAGGNALTDRKLSPRITPTPPLRRFSNDELSITRDDVYEDSANACMATGDFADAVRKFEPLLAWRERFLGHDNPSTWRTRASLARAYLGAGRAADAQAQFERAHRSWSSALGPNHPETRRVRNDFVRARELADRALAATNRISKGSLLARWLLLIRRHRREKRAAGT